MLVYSILRTGQVSSSFSGLKVIRTLPKFVVS